MKILIIDEVHTLLVNKLQEKGHTVKYVPNYTYEQTLEDISLYEGLVVRGKFQIDKKLIERGERLKFIARAGAGLDTFDIKEAEKRSIKIINASGANANSVAEHALGLILNLTHNITRSNEEVKRHQWNREANRGDELAEKTIAIIGFGNTGRTLANKLKVFGCDILAYDKYLSGYGNQYVKESNWDEIFEKADILSLHIPLTDETHYMCDDDFFNRFKHNLTLINTSRGIIIKENALLNALNAGRVKAAALDVLENENPNNFTATEKELISKTNVIVTPHIAGWSYQSLENIGKTLLKKIASLTN